MSRRAPSWHCREAHRQPVYAVAFNQADASQAEMFATVGSNWLSIYRLPPADEAAPDRPPEDPRGRKRMPRQLAPAPAALEPLQTYRDDDEDESFYCVEWGVGLRGEAIVAVAGKQRHIRLVDCHAAAAVRTLQGHGGGVMEVRFLPGRAALLLSASEDESARLWCTASACCLAIFAGQRGHRDAVLALDVRADLAFFASAGIDGTVRVWGLGEEVLQQRMGRAEAVVPGLAATEGAAAEAAAAATQSQAEAETALDVLQQVEAAAAAADEAAAAAAEEVAVEVEAHGDARESPARRTRHSATPEDRQAAEAGWRLAGGDPFERAKDVEAEAKRERAERQRAERDRAAADAVAAVAAADTEAATGDAGTAGAPASLPSLAEARGMARAARERLEEARASAAAAAAAAAAATAAAREAHGPPARVQLPVAEVDALHFDRCDGVSFYVDCVRWVGGLLLTRGTDERAVLWQPPPLDDATPRWVAKSPRPIFSEADVAPPAAAAPAAAPASAPTAAADPPCVLNEFVLSGTSLWFLKFTLDPQRRWLAMGSTMGTVAVWDVDAVLSRPVITCTVRRQTGKKHTAAADVTVRHTALSQDAARLVGACDDGSVYIWSLA